MFIFAWTFCRNRRPAECHINYTNYDGKSKELQASGLLATCIQHEIDHLDGILFIDYLSKLKKDMIIKKLIKQKEINKLYFRSDGFKDNIYGNTRVFGPNSKVNSQF